MLITDRVSWAPSRSSTIRHAPLSTWTGAPSSQTDLSRRGIVPADAQEVFGLGCRWKSRDFADGGGPAAQPLSIQHVSEASGLALASCSPQETTRRISHPPEIGNDLDPTPGGELRSASDFQPVK
jgi:hypothetical protein